jgi:allantoin racemase
MRILLVNPNSTASMTEKAARAARSVARQGTEIIPATPAGNPPSIQGYYDVAMCLPGLLGEIGRHPDVDAVVIACFDDTGLDAARAMVEVPVIGIGEAAFHAASMLSCRFSVVTTLRRSVPGIEANLVRYGLAVRCGRVRSTEIPVLELERGDPATTGRIADEIRRAIDEDAAEAIVLGCAGMTDLMQSLSDRFGIPVIDGIPCAITFAEALVATGARTSKIGGYAPSSHPGPQR